MTKQVKLLIVAIVVLLGGLVYLESAQKKVDWAPTYSVKDKNPLGTYVFYHSLKSIVEELHLVSRSPFEFFSDTTQTGQTYIGVHYSYPMNDAAQNALLKWVSVGNTALISAVTSELFTSDSLHLNWKYVKNTNHVLTYPTYDLVNPKLALKEKVVFSHPDILAYFSEIDTADYTVLGIGNFLHKDTVDLAPRINFIEISVGKGKLLLQTSPQAFSNYIMLRKTNYRYAEGALSYLDLTDKVFYDVYFDSKFKDYHNSPLYVLLGNKYLKWGYYFLLIGAVLFVLFEGKRRQKAIRVIPPVRNRSYDYVRTISGLYLQHKDHTAIAHKVIAQFLIELQKEWHIEIKVINEQLINRLTELTHHPAEEISTLFREIKRLQEKQMISKAELLNLNQLITHFKQQDYE